jgi:hypothetical protein
MYCAAAHARDFDELDVKGVKDKKSHNKIDG